MGLLYDGREQILVVPTSRSQFHTVTIPFVIKIIYNRRLLYEVQLSNHSAIIRLFLAERINALLNVVKKKINLLVTLMTV